MWEDPAVQEHAKIDLVRLTGKMEPGILNPDRTLEDLSVGPVNLFVIADPVCDWFSFIEV